MCTSGPNKIRFNVTTDHGHGWSRWSKYFNVAESACLQCMSWVFDWGNSTCQPFLTSNWHFWQMTQMSDKSLLYKTEKTQISGQTQIIWVGWGLWAEGGTKYGPRAPWRVFWVVDRGVATSVPFPEVWSRKGTESGLILGPKRALLGAPEVA